MANTRLSMRKIEEVLRLHCAGGRSNREIAQAVRVSPTTVADYLRRARRAGLTWPLADGTTERTVETALFPPTPASGVKRPEPDWAAVHRQLGRSGVTLDLLWQEYRERHPEGYQYSAFCLATTGPSPRPCPSPCARAMRRANACSWQLRRPDRGGRRSHHRGGASGPKSSWPCSGRRTTPSSKRPGPRGWRTGLVRTCAAWSSSARFPVGWCRTTSRPGCPPPTAMDRTSTPATPTWRPTTGWRSSRPGRPSRATRRRHHTVSCGVDGKVIRCGSRGVLHPWPLTTVSPAARGANRQRWPFP